MILGQDPYHTPGVANGLAFSVEIGAAIPPSLRNILKELESDLDLDWGLPANGDLTPWAKQGVLLLNTSLTVAEGSPGSHANIGWRALVEEVVNEVDQLDDIVWILWGKHAQSFAPPIDGRSKYIINSAHPSPFSADRGFFGSRPFSKCNNFLREMGKTAIDWRLP